MFQEVIVPIKTTQEKYMHELGDIYDAEQQFLKAQQEMLQQATDPTLKQGIQQHITESQQQVQNIEQVFQVLGEKPKAEKCPAAAGLVTEGKQNAKEAGTNEIRDCLIGGALTKVEHYEIASYRGLIEGAQAMGQKQIVQLLQQNLQQEEKTAQKLEQSAPTLIKKAMQAEGMHGQQTGQTSARTMS
jgi:ferritin-like metal-binding protein YciE